MGVLLPAVARAALQAGGTARRGAVSVRDDALGARPRAQGLSARGARRRRRAAVPGDARRIRGGGVRSRPRWKRGRCPGLSRGRRGARRGRSLRRPQPALGVGERPFGRRRGGQAAGCRNRLAPWRRCGHLPCCAPRRCAGWRKRRRAPCRSRFHRLRIRFRAEGNAAAIELSDVALPLDAGLPDGAALVRQAAAQRARRARCGERGRRAACSSAAWTRARRATCISWRRSPWPWPTRRRRSGCWPRRARSARGVRARPLPPARAAFRARSGRRGGAGGRAAPPGGGRGAGRAVLRAVPGRKPGCGRSWSSGARAWRSAPPPWPRSRRAARSIRRRTCSSAKGARAPFPTAS